LLTSTTGPVLDPVATLQRELGDEANDEGGQGGDDHPDEDQGIASRAKVDRLPDPARFCNPTSWVVLVYVEASPKQMLPHDRRGKYGAGLGPRAKCERHDHKACRGEQSDAPGDGKKRHHRWIKGPL
jgi:hypothetical protein